MSCITMVGRRRVVPEGCDQKLRYTAPHWTESKAARLRGMATSRNPHVRAVAAGHPRIGARLLWRLLVDESVMVRRAAVKNPTVDADMMSRAAEDADPGIRAYARSLGVVW